LKFRKNLWR